MRSTSRALLLFCVVGIISPACMCTKQPPTMATLKDEREPCEHDEECKTGLCDAVPGFQTVCVRKCTETCKADEVCTQLTPGRFSCNPDHGGLCRTCMLDSDCPYPADKCILVDNQGVCGRDCAFDQNCPTSYRCLNGLGVDMKSKPQQCTPASGSCACTAASAGQTISCMTTNAKGTCNGVRTCDGISGYGACDARTPSDEACNNIDDNCNGLTDEGLPSITCGIGACMRTIALCGDDGGVMTCNPGNPVTEICNNIDDDCNGVTDNGFNLQTDITNCGACGTMCSFPNSVPRCASGVCEVLSCNAGYANCNGIFPDGCEVNTDTNVNHCGACNHQCYAPGANSTCTGGVCGFTCQPGHYDLDGDPSNGCEYACTATSMTDEPDVAFTDANCDGMDGEINNGIYVSPLGNDGNPGTMMLPKLTILNAAQTAGQMGKRDVYVSGGTYSGPVNLTGITGKNIAGGYAPATARWTRSPINTTTIQGGSPALLLDGSDNLRVQFFSVRGDAVNGTESTGQGKSAYGGQVKNSAGVKLELMTFVAGNAAPGSDGSAGTTGSPGGNGGTGAKGCVQDGSSLCGSCSTPSVGSGGTSTCGRPGGPGGAPGRKNPSNSPEAAQSGGTGQIGTSPGSGSPSNDATGNGENTAFGYQNGATGSGGSAGSNGAAGATLGVFLDGGIYVPAVATSGLAGTPGNGGGGAGGGGGGCEPRYVPITGSEFCYCFSYGSAGGGGGAGGCGGTPGQGGKGGGASIALMLWRSTVIATQVTLQPGRGGNGGKGGNGGGGGTPGQGGGSLYDWNQQGYSRIGGRGGNGGNGGAGGHGGGGAGGAAIGLLRDAASTNITGVTYTAGNGGTGGTSSGAAGPNGVTVQSQQL